MRKYLLLEVLYLLFLLEVFVILLFVGSICCCVIGTQYFSNQALHWKMKFNKFQGSLLKVG